MSKENIEIIELENGLIAGIWEDHNTEVVEIRIYIRAGSIYEEEFQGSGISHFLEHLIAGGPTQKRSKKEIDDAIEKFGNVFNAYTTKCHTSYHITTVKKFFPEALDLLVELVFDNKITSEKYKREKGVILREIEKSEEEPQSFLYRLTSENLYKVNQSRFPVIGYTDLFKKITDDNLKDYYKRKYVPNNAIIVVGGAVDRDEAGKLIKERFVDYKREFHTLPSLIEEPVILSKREKMGFRDIEGIYMNLSWQTIPLNHPDLFALDMLSEILSTGRSSILNRLIKEEKELVNAIDSYSHTPSYGKGEFTIQVRFKDTPLKEVEEEILKVIQNIQKNGVSVEELNKAKKLSLSAHLFEKTSVSGYTSRIGIDLISTGDKDFSKRYIEGLKKVTGDDVQKVANKYLNTSRYAKTFIRGTVPFLKSKKELSPNFVPTIARKITLKNGIRVILKKIPDISVASYSVFFQGGLTHDKHYKLPGLFGFFSSMLSRGTVNYTKDQLAEEFEKRGASFASSAGNNTFYIQAASLSDDYPVILKLIKEVIFDPSFDENEIKKLKKFTVQAIEQQNNDWQKEAFLNFKKHIFPESLPYIYSSIGTTESVKGISGEDLLKIRNEFIIPSNMVISIVGDFDVDELEKEVIKIFDNIPSSKIQLPDYDSEFIKLDEDFFKKYTTGKDLAVIFMGFPTVTIYDRETGVILDVIDTIISGGSFPGGWLHERMRGDELVYVVHGYNMRYLKSGCFTIFAATNKEKLQKSLNVIKKVIDDLRKAKYTDNEIEKAKDQIITSHQLYLQSPSSQAHNYALNEIFGFGYDFDEKYLEMIKNVKRSDIKKVVKKYFSNSVTVITAP